MFTVTEYAALSYAGGSPRWSRIVFLPGVRSFSSEFELDRVNPGSAGS